MDNLKEDTVSADRKERIIFDPDAWRKSDKSGRKTSAITSRQNFDNEKFTRKAKQQDQVDEGTIQPSGDSKVESAGPTQSDTISKDKKIKKSNSPQIEFVTGTATPNGSSSTAQGNQPMTGRKLAEAIIGKAIKQVHEGKMGEKAAGNLDFEKKAKADTSPPWDTTGDDEVKNFKKPHNPNRTPLDTVRALAQKGMKKNVQEACKDDVKKKQTVKKEGTDMSKTYTEFMDQLLEYTPGPGGVTRVQGRSYGAQYHDPEGDDDAWEKEGKAKPAAAAPAEKRGRGRPSGSYGTYKARSAETKAAAAAKSAATKAANKAK